MKMIKPLAPVYAKKPFFFETTWLKAHEVLNPLENTRPGAKIGVGMVGTFPGKTALAHRIVLPNGQSATITVMHA